MKVNLREKKLKNGMRSLYLDFYPPIIVEGKQTRREFLKLHIYDKPKTEAERDFNRETRTQAEFVRSTRQLDLQANPHGYVSPRRKAGDFIAFFRQFVEEKESLKPATVRKWRAILNHFIAFSNNSCSFADVNAALLERFRRSLLERQAHQRGGGITGTRQKSVNSRLASNTAKVYFERFLAVVRSAFQKKYLDNDPTTTAKTISQTTPAREFLTLGELRHIANTPADIPDNLRCAALFSALTGLRFSDIKNLTWGSVRTGGDGETSLYLQIQKTGERLIQPISDEARELLGAAGVASEKAIKDLKYDGYTNFYIGRWAKAAGIERKITFHAFRRSYATGLLANGVDFHTISGMLGHSDLRQTQIYARLLDEKKRTAANKITLK